MGNYLRKQGEQAAGKHYYQAGLTVADTLFSEPYLSESEEHQGLILHSIYHRPNGWDHIPEGSAIPCGESSMWGDYHARELGPASATGIGKSAVSDFLGKLVQDKDFQPNKRGSCKKKAQRETEFFLQNSVSLHYFLT